jgi:hypothetical protein
MISDTAIFPARLFRYAEPEHARQWMQDGVVALGRAESYLRTELLPAQQDNERRRVYRPDMRRIRIYAGEPGNTRRPLQGVSDFSMTYDLPGYYLLCLSLAQSLEMAAEWPGYSCIEIHDPTAFFHRLDAAMMKQLPNYVFIADAVSYVEQDSFPKKPAIRELIYTKFEKYRYQQEYRVALLLDNDPAPVDSLADICSPA